MRLLHYGVLSLFLMIFTPTFLHAWARHNLITKYVLKDNEDYRNSIISVTEISPDNSINPEYVSLYTNPDSQKNIVVCNKFVNYDLENGLYYGFEGKGVGEKTSIYEVLINFSDEPDWGMDKNLNLSFAQKFMAGSQGLRHMYYPFWTFHLPYPLIAQGEAPERAQHFFERAVAEYLMGNYYAAYRELARSIHYVMDMGQPFHTRQLYYKLIQIYSPFDGTVQAIKNYHFAYETFVANLLQMEDCAGKGSLMDAILSARPLRADRAEDLAVLVAINSSVIAKKLIPATLRVLGEKFNSSDGQFLSEDEFNKLVLRNSNISELIEPTQGALALTSGAVKCLLFMFEKRVENRMQLNSE